MPRGKPRALTNLQKKLALTAGALAATAGVITNIDKVGSAWNRYGAPLFETETHLTVTFEAPPDRMVRLAVNPDADGKYLTVEEIVGGKSVQLRLGADKQHKLEWQGPYLRPAAHTIIVGGKPTNWRLAITGREGDRDVLTIEEASTGRLGSPVQVSAESLLRAAEAVPGKEFWQRAMRVVGLFETGTPDCADALQVTESSIGYGCVNVAPGFTLWNLAREAEKASPGLLNRTMGAREADLRATTSIPVTPIPTDRDFVSRLRALTAAPAFQRARDRLVIGYYRQSEVLAARTGLTSERGRLFMFDRVYHTGSPSTGRLADLALADPRFLRMTDQEKLLRLAELGKARHTRFPEGIRRALDRRIDLYATGKGQVQGVTYDLDAMGFRLA